MSKQNILGPRELSLLSTLTRQRRRAFQFDRAAAILAGASRPVVRNTLSRLVRKGYLQRVKRGSYMLVPFGHTDHVAHELAAAPSMVADYYVSFWSALSYWGMTEQLPRRVTVAVPKPQRTRTFQGASYRFVTLAPRYYFGFQAVEIDGREVNLAGREKAILDCLLHPCHCGGLGEPVKALREQADELDWAKMADHLSRMVSSALERRLHYCLNRFGLERQLSALGPHRKFSGYRWLDPEGPKEQKAYDHRFGLLVNVNLDEEMA